MSVPPDNPETMQFSVDLNREWLRTEFERSLEALSEIDEQIRNLPGVIARAQGPDADMTALEVSKIVSATLAVGARLLEQHERVRKALVLAPIRAARPA